MKTPKSTQKTHLPTTPMSWRELKAAAGVGLIPLGVLSQSMGISIVYNYLYMLRTG